jgi:hypothetical protein
MRPKSVITLSEATDVGLCGGLGICVGVPALVIGAVSLTDPIWRPYLTHGGILDISLAAIVIISIIAGPILAIIFMKGWWKDWWSGG